MEKKMEGVLLTALISLLQSPVSKAPHHGANAFSLLLEWPFRVVYHFFIGVTVGLGQT
jgi:hypothetical protein